MIRFAENADHPRLKALWMEAFGDPRDAVETYFALRHKNENMLVNVQGGKVTGMLSMLPAALCTGGHALAARYIYAVATDIRCRRPGCQLIAVADRSYAYERPGRSRRRFGARLS